MADNIKHELCVGAVTKMENQYSTHFEENFNVDGTPEGIDLEGIFNAPQEHIDEIVGYSKYCYRKYGLIMRTINIMRDFGSMGLKLSYPTKNKKAKEVIEDYNERINVIQLIRDFFQELGLTGNLACYDRVNRVEIYPINKIEVLPLIIDNRQIIAYKTEVNTVSEDYGSEYNKMIEEAYPEEIIEANKKGSTYAILNKDNAHFGKINSSQYERYGISVIVPAFEDLAHKSLLKEAERATANDVIDKMMVIQVGNDEVKPKREMIEGYDRLFQGVKGSVRFTVPYYVDAKFIEPQTNVFGREKFLEVDTDILNTLGISLSLLRGSDGSNYADGVLNFSGLTKSIENIRQPIARILNELYEAEMIRNGLDVKHAPKAYFEDVVIDKAAKMELMMNLFQNAGMPYEILYEEAGLDFDYIKLVRKTENDEELDELFKPRTLPFGGMVEETEDGNNGQQKNKGGRPKKNESQRKSGKEQSNNNQPRAGVKGTLRGNSANKPK